MSKLNSAIVLCSVITLASCGGNTNDNSKARKADSTAVTTKKGDTEKHDKLVVGLAKDTNRNNFTDANGKKQGHWVITNETEHLPGYKSDAKVAEGVYQDDMKEGEWIEYNADGSEKSRLTFKNDKPVK